MNHAIAELLDLLQELQILTDHARQLAGEIVEQLTQVSVHGNRFRDLQQGPVTGRG